MPARVPTEATLGRRRGRGAVGQAAGAPPALRDPSFGEPRRPGNPAPIAFRTKEVRSRTTGARKEEP
jgi:hypothetical protein